MNRSIRTSPWLLLIEVVLFVLIFIAQQWHLIPVSKIPFLFLVCWVSLRIRGQRWRDVGLARFRSWPVTLGLGAALGVGMELLQLFVTQPLLVSVTKRGPDLSFFRRLAGNPKLLVVMLLLVWTLAAFGEELVYRGFVLNRLAEFGNGTKAAWVTSLLLMSIAFGFAHYEQGITGIIDEGFMGLLFGLAYLDCNRKLAVPIIAHGIQDTVDMVLLYLGKYPGM
jgi:membrane protease YdiL (CAAX protease family)